MWTDVVSAFSALATALLTLFLLIAAVLAWRTAKETVQAAKDANEQAQRDSIERTRPYVFAEVVGSLMGSPHWDLRITNMGNSAALMFETPRTLPPQGSLRVYWRLQARDGFTDGSTELGMPRTGTITATYTSDDPSHPAYTDSYEVLIDASGWMPVPEDGFEPEELSSSEKKFYSLARAIARHLGELRR